MNKGQHHIQLKQAQPSLIYMGYTIQPTFGMIDDEARRKKITMLDDIAEIIDFQQIEKLLMKMYKSKTGRPPILSLMLFKAFDLSWQ